MLKVALIIFTIFSNLIGCKFVVTKSFDKLNDRQSDQIIGFVGLEIREPTDL